MRGPCIRTVDAAMRARPAHILHLERRQLTHGLRESPRGGREAGGR